MASRLNLTNKERKEKRRKSAIFHNRKSSHISKAAEMHKKTGASVFIAYKFKNRLYTFTTANAPDWPPSKKQIVSEILPPELTDSNLFSAGRLLALARTLVYG